MVRSIDENSDSQSEPVYCNSNCDCAQSESKSSNNETSSSSESPPPALPKRSSVDQKAGHLSEKSKNTNKSSSTKARSKSEGYFDLKSTKENEKDILANPKKVKETTSSPSKRVTKIKNLSRPSEATSSFTKRKSNSPKREGKGILSTLRTLDEEHEGSSAMRSRSRSFSSGSELGSDFYVEKPAVKKVKKDKKSKTMKKGSTEGKDMIRFTKEEDEEMIAFIDSTVNLSNLQKHMKDRFPDRQRASSSIYARRNVLFAKWRKSI